MQIETVIDAHATIGESPTWVADQAALYWIDVKAPALHCHHPESGARRSWPLTSDVGAFCFIDSRTALVALRHGIHRLDLETGALDLIVLPPFDPALFRFNEGACDAAGRFWVGVMFDPLDGDPPAQRGALHRFTLGGGLEPVADMAELHNGMAWSADQRTFFVSHSNRRDICVFDHDPETGALSNRRLFATIPEEDGIPDGAAIDVDGGYWSALHGGGRLRRFRANGSVDRDVALPVSQPTMAAFAGDDLAKLYVTSASDKMTKAELAQEPLAGAVFRFDPGVRGIPRPFIVR